MKDVIISPVATEKSMLALEKENTLTFIVERKATKSQIKREIERRFDVKVINVRTMISLEGKKAMARLDPEFSADDVFGRIGVF